MEDKDQLENIKNRHSLIKDQKSYFEHVVYSADHDLKAHTRSLAGYCFMSKDSFEEEITDNLESYFEAAETKIDHLAKELESVSDFRRKLFLLINSIAPNLFEENKEEFMALLNEFTLSNEKRKKKESVAFLASDFYKKMDAAS